jgi:outer membrane receptor protein involved in Fe transport
MRSLLLPAARSVPFLMIVVWLPWAEAADPVAPPTGPDSAVVLNPFEVQANSDRGYSAMNSNSITAFNLALDHAPVSADIMDKTFLDDVGVLTVEQALQQFDAGSAFAAGNVTNAAQNQPGDRVASPTAKVRGSNINGVQTNGIQINAGNYGQTNFGTTSLYDVERVEVVYGAQSLLFGGGGAGAVVNLVTNQAVPGRPAFAVGSFLVDQYGSKRAKLDVGAASERFAVRFTAVDETNDTRRVNIGDQLQGQYLQLVGRLWNTTLRVSLQQSLDNRLAANYTTLSSSGDPAYSAYNTWHLETLLATNRAAGILNGKLNWTNAESLAGQQNKDSDVSESAIITLASTWTKWFSTEFTVADANFDADQNGQSTLNFYSPGATANPLPGNWTMNMGSSATNPALSDNWRAHDSKAIRFTALLTNELFHGSAKSQTSFDADYTRSRNDITQYSYYQTDSTGNILVNPNVAASNGRTPLGPLSWTVNNGPVLYALPNFLTGSRPKVLASDKLTINGLVYERALINYYNPAISGDNLGISTFAATGYAVVNYTQWMGGKLDTMAGMRFTHAWSATPSELYKPSFSLGADYHVNSWLVPYFDWSSIWSTQSQGTSEPDGSIEGPAHDVGEELGLKFDPADGKISGSISGYVSSNHDQNVSVPNVSGAVSPNGLNGQLPGGTGNNQPANVLTYGANASLTANPTSYWRMRLSAAWTGGTYKSGVQYNQNYNDQFHTNSSGAVTYADGAAVFVPATFNKSQLTVPAGTPGAVPLTVTLLSTPGGQYYTTPAVVTGAISKTSNGGLVLLSTPDPVHGSILTGKTGLPASSYQLNTALTGVVPYGSIYVAQPGSQTSGYPAYAFAFTSVYTLPSGWVKGFYFGGTASAQWRNLALNYNPSSTQLSPSDDLDFYLPTLVRFDVITGYTRKFGRFTWTSRLNINNVFNQYKVILFPTTTTGFSSAPSVTANLSQNPRYYSWTNSISF